jgi:phage gp29-like protein
MMSRIVDINGVPIERSILREPQTSQISSLYNTFAEHPSQRLTPQRLERILNEAETGNLSAQADLFTDMEERDSHLFAEMQKRKRALLTIGHQVVPPPNATPTEQADAAWLAEFITELDGWEDLIIDCLDAIGQGFSNIEIQWKLMGREWYPAKFEFRPQSWFMLDPNDQNRLLLRTDDGLGALLQPFGWICHRHKSRSGYVARAGLLRTLSWPYIFRNFGVQSLAELLEIYGIPLRIGKYPEGIGKKEKNELMRAVTELGRYAGGIIPKEMEIALHQAATGSHDPFMSLAEWAEKSMSKAILGGTLTTQADGKTATNALGVIHNDVRDDLLISDSKQFAATIRSDLFWPLLVLNRNANADPRRTPRLIFNKPTPAQAQASGQTFNLRLEPTAVTRQSPVAALVAALTRQTGDPTQEGIDAALTALLQEGQTADQLIAMLVPALSAAAQANDETQLLGVLAEAFPQMDATALRSSLGDTLAIARLVGLYSAQRERR